MSDFWRTIDPARVVALTMIGCAALSVALGAVAAIIALLQDRKKASLPNPDPFLEPGSVEGLRAGPIPARARLSET